MTPTEFIESRRVEGGLLGGVFVPPKQAEVVERQVVFRQIGARFTETVKNLWAAWQNLSPEVRAAIEHFGRIEEDHLLNGDGAPGFNGFFPPKWGETLEETALRMNKCDRFTCQAK